MQVVSGEGKITGICFDFFRKKGMQTLIGLDHSKVCQISLREVTPFNLRVGDRIKFEVSTKAVSGPKGVSSRHLTWYPFKVELIDDNGNILQTFRFFDKIGSKE